MVFERSLVCVTDSRPLDRDRGQRGRARFSAQSVATIRPYRIRERSPAMDVKRSRRDFLRSAGSISVAGLFAASSSPGVAADRQKRGQTEDSADFTWHYWRAAAEGNATVFPCRFHV